MKSFEFRLASVVRIRETQLRSEESRLEQLQAQRRGMELDLENLQRSLDRAWVCTKSRDTLQSSDLMAMRSMEEQAQRDRVAIHNRMTSLDELIQKQRAIVIEIRRNLRLLEKLRAKRHGEWQAEADRELALLIDDTTNTQWMRRRQLETQSDSWNRQNVTEKQTLPSDW